MRDECAHDECTNVQYTRLTKHMSRPVKILLSIVLSAVMVLWVILPARFDVFAPRLGMPAIVHAGQPVTVTVKTSVPFWQPHWQAWLGLRESRIPLQITDRQSGLATQALTFVVPASLGDGSYSLTLSDGDNEIVRPGAVFVQTTFPKQITIVQLADLPTLAKASVEGEGDRLMQQLVDEINIINPDLVLMTGDVAYGGAWSQYYRLLRAMERFDAPLIAVPGNHEYQGWAAYLTLLGTPYHTVQYGDLQIISLNSGHGRDQLTESQYGWLRDAIRQTEGRVPLVQIHHPLHHRPELRGYVGSHVNDMVSLFHDAQVPIVLSGHWHGDAVYDESGRDRRDTWNFPGVPYVVTTTAGADLREKYSSSPLHHGYRLIRLQTSGGAAAATLQSYTYDWDGDGRRDAASSIPVGKLRARQSGPTSLIIENNLHEALTHARVKIIVPGNDLTLLPDQGQLIRRYPDKGQTVYEIGLSLAAVSRTEIHLLKQHVDEGSSK